MLVYLRFVNKLRLGGQMYKCTNVQIYKCTNVQVYKCINNFLPRAPPIRNSISFFEVAKVLPACPSDTSSSKISGTLVQ